MAGTLEGLRVITVEQAMTEPFCTIGHTNAGARVIKIEHEGGDFARVYDDAAPRSCGPVQPIGEHTQISLAELPANKTES